MGDFTAPFIASGAGGRPADAAKVVLDRPPAAESDGGEAEAAPVDQGGQDDQGGVRGAGELGGESIRHKKYLPEFIPEFVPEYKAEYRLNSRTNY